MSMKTKEIASLQVTEVQTPSSQDELGHLSQLSVQKGATLTVWSREIFSWVLSVAALGAIVGFTHYYENLPLPRWPRGISINTIISILIIVQKGNLLRPVVECICQLKWRHFEKPQPVIDLLRFDATSRDPVDSALLLMRLPKNSLAMIGALITIAGLAIGPFCQQLVRYDDCLHTEADGTTVDTIIIGAFYRGIFKPPSDPATMIPYNCPTGNCTFSSVEGVTHTSLGICYSFEDINSTISAMPPSNASGANPSSIDYRLPSGLTLTTSMGDTLVTQLVTSNYTNLLTFDTLMMKYGKCRNELDWRTCDGLYPYAFRSALVPCVKNCFGDIRNHALTEQIVSSTPLVGSPDAQWLFLATERTLRNGTWHQCNPQASATLSNPVAIPPIGDQTTTTNDTSTVNVSSWYYPEDCVWVFPRNAARPFDNLAKLFDQQKLNAGIYTVPPYAKGQPQLIVLARDGTANPGYIEGFLNNLSLSITADMRTRGDSGSAGWTTGVALVSDTCVFVSWYWIILPAALLIITAGLLAVVVAQNSGSASLPVWKSSGLPLALYSLENGAILRTGCLNNISSMEREAAAIKATLLRQPNGSWKFVGTENEIATKT